VDAAKSGGQEVRVGEVFAECAEKTGFPGFGFFRRGDNCALRGEDGSQRGKCNSQKMQLAGSKDGGWMYTDRHPGAKMEIPANVQNPAVYCPMAYWENRRHNIT
jgi:hypothetical protein